MVRSKNDKIFQIFAHVVLILMVFIVAVPFLLLFMSSITEENTLVRNGYSFWPENFSLAAYEYIWNQRGQIFRAYGITILLPPQVL